MSGGQMKAAVKPDKCPERDRLGNKRHIDIHDASLRGDRGLAEHCQQGVGERKEHRETDANDERGVNQP
jgi:hypothetical protein